MSAIAILSTTDAMLELLLPIFLFCPDFLLLLFALLLDLSPYSVSPPAERPCAPVILFFEFLGEEPRGFRDGE